MTLGLSPSWPQCVASAQWAMDPSERMSSTKGAGRMCLGNKEAVGGGAPLNPASLSIQALEMLTHP